MEGRGIKSYEIPASYIVRSATDSKGAQPKWYMDGYWYKQDNVGKEGAAEELCSMILACSTVSDFVQYERCIVNGKMGCRSKNFLKDGEQFITFQRLYENYEGGSLANRVMTYRDVPDRIDFVENFLVLVTGIDVHGYLQDILALDMLTLNIDRHFHNLGVIRRADGNYDTAPIFDNGQAFFQNRSIFLPYMDFEEKRRSAMAAPFSGSFEQQAMAAGIRMKIDMDKLRELAAGNELLPVLDKQLELYKKIFDV